MIKLLKKSGALAISIISVLFIFIPEDVFNLIALSEKLSEGSNIILNRIIVFIMIFLLVLLVELPINLLRNKIKLKGENYEIVIKYGDIFKEKNCKKVIPFDECFSTTVGAGTGDINPRSICGQYLETNPITDMESLISRASIKSSGKSKYKSKGKFVSGQVIIRGEYWLLAFAKLDKEGRGYMSRNEYAQCLSVLWDEIDKNYGQNDVCLPILGSGITRMENSEITQQELLDIMIASYKLSNRKIQKPNKLIIICKKRDDFSLNRIGKYIGV